MRRGVKTIHVLHRSTATFNLPPGLPASLAGTLPFHHAYVVFGVNSFDLASNPVPLTLVK